MEKILDYATPSGDGVCIKTAHDSHVYYEYGEFEDRLFFKVGANEWNSVRVDDTQIISDLYQILTYILNKEQS